VQIPVTEETTVDSLLDTIYFALAPAVKPFTYNKTWILTDDSGKNYTDIGTIWAKDQNLPRDTRPITEVGIFPGSTLPAVAKGRAERAFNRELEALVNQLRSRLSTDGVTVENVSGRQLPRLVARSNGSTYGLYAMPGNPSEYWVELARAAAARLESKAGNDEDVVPVLALNQQPSTRLLETAAGTNVLVTWLDNDMLHGAPWPPTGQNGT